VVLIAGHRHKLKDSDLTSIYSNGDNDESALHEINAIKEAAEISMGTDITDQDVMNIQSLAEQVISMTEYRSQLYEYLRNRMNAIAPNLTILTGELVGARLIAHAGSLINLAKQPASTVQILGAEKALFRALKTKHDTPKYGLIYHASLIGQAAPKHKGKISRVLAAKASLAIRVDALSDDTAAGDEIDTTVGYEGRAKVEARLRQLDGGTHLSGAVAKNGTNLKAQKTAKYDPVVAKVGAANVSYNTASDIMHLDTTTNGDDNDNNKMGDESAKKKEKKAKKEKKRKKDDEQVDKNGTSTTEAVVPPVNESLESPPPKKKRKENDEDDDEKKKSDKKAAKKAKKEKRKSQE
jgi:nucleolar protein 58